MNYILKNKQVFDAVYSYLTKEFEDLDWLPGYDYTRDEETDDLIFFRLPQELEEDNVFELVKESWYTRKFDSPIKGKTRETEEVTDKWLPKAPILEFLGGRTKKNLNNLFGEYWKPVFKQWFRDNFPQFPVKTFYF